MPWTGPVAYHPHVSGFTWLVISEGSAQLWPSSLLWVTNTRLLFQQKGSQMIPVSRSTTGAGFRR